jgi:alpha-ketoglutarate-dependent 2,4-dichlorophenoxyacetate dioxygenase
MTLSLHKLHPLFVAEVSGIDITRPLTTEQAKAVEGAIAEHAVLVFRDARLTDEQQLAVSRAFGELEITGGTGISRPGEQRLDAAFADVSNLDKDNKPLARDNRRRLYSLGNRLWHSDSSFKAVPARYSLLSCRQPGLHGGNTEFADMRAAYDALNDATRQEIENLIAEHSLLYSREQLGFTDLSPEERERMRPVLQRLVRRHPISGRKSLYLASHIGRVIGWPVPEARAFIRDLMEHATQPQFVYVHQWRQHDLVMWDNRVTMHRVRRYDDRQPRDMRRTTVAGTETTTSQAVAAE